MDRVIGLIDMDCFYAQVEQRERPELWNMPVAVVQHAGEGNPGLILAVSYEARSFGVKRGMMIAEAKAKCPELNVCFVPQGEHIDKADIQKYRDASAEVFGVLNSFDERIVVERASVDEAFLDLTEMLLSNVSSAFPTTHLADGTDKDSDEEYDRESKVRSWLEVQCAKEVSHLRLAIAAHTIEQMRARIREHTQFFCSAGIANNKMLAKLVCSRHKPRQETVLPSEFVDIIFMGTPIGEVRMLGGKLGHAIQNCFGIRTMSDLAAIPFEMIERHFEGQAQWIHQIAKGYDSEPVKQRDSQLSIAVSKNFPGKNALKTIADNKRTAENIVLSILGETHTSRTLKIASYKPQVLAEIIWGAAKTYNRAPPGSDQWYVLIPPIFNLSMSASRFIEGVNAQSQSIMEWVEKRLKLSESGTLLLFALGKIVLAMV
uniref:UmuC domain-containing protein n=1 Tax=Angiostrongylus cantonensis TaxID=6313 RepID=A0A158P7P8_ANGCA